MLPQIINLPARQRAALIERNRNMTTSTIYQLAPCPETYGQDASKFIVTSADHEEEFSGPMSKRDASAFAGMLDALTTLHEDCRMALSGEWDKSDEGFEAMQEVIDNAIADATGRAA
jgi:hypothetical protein